MFKTPLLISLLCALLASVQAHELIRSTDGKVGALVHLEPDDNPLAKTPTRVWFELTQRGGTPIALSSCICTLKVYAGAYKVGHRPLSSLPLTAGRDGEGKGKPSTTVTFPREGTYTLLLEGRPRTAAPFAPFRIQIVTRARKAGEDHSH